MKPYYSSLAHSVKYLYLILAISVYQYMLSKLACSKKNWAEKERYQISNLKIRLKTKYNKLTISITVSTNYAIRFGARITFCSLLIQGQSEFKWKEVQR